MSNNTEIEQASNNTEMVIVAEWSDLQIYPVPQVVYSLLCSYMTVVTFISMILNGAVIITTYKCKKLRRPLNYMLLNLAVADFLSASIGGFISIMANASSGFFMGRFICWMDGFLVGTFGIANLMSIVFLSLSRYIVICKPCGIEEFSRKHAIAAVTVTWLWSSAWSSVPLFYRAYDLEGIGTSCGLIGHNTHILSSVHLIVYFVFCFLFPLLIMMVAYILILINVWKASRRQASNATTRSERMEIQTTKMVIVIMIAFLTCWTPYACIAMHIVVRPSIKLNQYITTFPAFFAKSATIYNPCIYVLMNTRFRRILLQLIHDKISPVSGSSGTTQQRRTSGHLRVAYTARSISKPSSSNQL